MKISCRRHPVLLILAAVALSPATLPAQDHPDQHTLDPRTVSYRTDETTVADIDGNIYHPIPIGSQVWMVENLNTTSYSNGDPIPNVTSNTAWSVLTTGAYCNYMNSPGFATTYGRLYNWHAVQDVRNIAPTGWHVATDADWVSLIDHLGGTEAAGGKLKEIGLAHWLSPNTGATNEVAFTALPGGYRESTGAFLAVGGIGSWWTSTENSAADAWAMGIFNDASHVDRGWYYSKRIAFSVRCVRNAPASGVEDDADNSPRIRLLRNYPNPFNPCTTIAYRIEARSFVRLSIMNAKGEVVAEAVHEIQAPGVHEYRFDAADLPSGVYFCRLQAGNQLDTGTMVLIR